MHPAALSDDQLLGQCDERRQRRSGPGGQHRNKVETGVVLTHRATGIKAEAYERRSQVENRREALRRLRIRLAMDVREPADPARPPSERWQSRLRGTRIELSAAHADFPALLAELLDRLDALGYDVPRAAERLGCTGSQLVKLLAKEPRALELVNQQRQQRGLRPLR